MKLTFPNGQELDLAPANFSDEACELVELTEEAQDYQDSLQAALKRHPEPEETGDATQDKAARIARNKAISDEVPPFRKFGKMMRMVRNQIKESAKRSGASDADIERALCSITMEDNKFIGQLREALGIDA